MKHLQFNYMVAQAECGENRHAQDVMRELGITYRYATPQSLGDAWWFVDCENVPDELPKYLTDLPITVSFLE